MHGAIDAWRVHKASPLARVASRDPRVVISLPLRYGRTLTDRVADPPRGKWWMSYERRRLTARPQTGVDGALQDQGSPASVITLARHQVLQERRRR